MPNFPGSNQALPGVYTQVTTLSKGVSIPGGQRSAVLMGEGSRIETIVASANGGGNDGLDSTFTTTTGQDGRHFQLSNAPIISNRTTLYKNGVTLAGTEGTNNESSFSSAYDYRIDITDGTIELQAAALVDQGGAYYSASALNVGTGEISNLTLVDENAPSETWTVRCTSVRRDGYGDPIDGYAKFVVQGSVSGTILDGYGNQIFWQSNGVLVSNGILSFSISEGATAFQEGDRFTIEVEGGVLLAGDSLTATYIATTDINTPEYFTDINALTTKHGSPSLTNRLSLGAQLTFANTPPGVWALQAAPSIPRRVSYVLEESASGGTAVDDLTFALPLGVVPDADTNINFFITDPVTEVESQIIPNKVDFYDAAITASPTSFINGAGYVFSYTVILDETTGVVKEDNDGVLVSLGGSQATISSATVNFNIDDLSATRSLKIFNAASANNGTHTIVSISDGVMTIQHETGGTFVGETSVEFQVLDSSIEDAKILWTDDLAMTLGQSLRATIVDTRDADFFDVGWISAYEALETIETDIIVPLPSQTISAIFQNGKSHVEYMSNIKNRKERVLFIGAIQGLEPANVIGTTNAAVEDIGILEGIQGDDVSEVLAGNIEDLANYGVQNAYSDTYRVCYFYPDEIVVQIGADRTLVDGFFISAAAAGFLSAMTNIAVPLTNKTLSGFTILSDKQYRPITLEQLTASGITVLQPITGGGRVIRGQTTTNSGYLEELELSIVFIRDRIAKNMRQAFQGFIGTAESSILKGSLISRATGMLNGFITQGYITSWTDLKVDRDEVDPTQWNVKVHVQPTYPVNFVYIEFTVGIL